MKLDHRQIKTIFEKLKERKMLSELHGEEQNWYKNVPRTEDVKCTVKFKKKNETNGD